VSLQAHRRRVLCVIGPSGCGKSTLAEFSPASRTSRRAEVLLDGAPIRGPVPIAAWCSRLNAVSLAHRSEDVMFGLE